MKKNENLSAAGEIGTNVPKNVEEMEEDFLEVIYQHWRNGEPMRLVDFAMETGENKTHIRSLARRLMNHRYIKMEDDLIILTDIGKMRGKECLDRHHKLTQFFQMVSGMDQQEAERDACRVEHTISRAAMEGITNFLIRGDVYDRSYSNMDLSLLFEPGTYEMAMEIYEIERRQPRIIAREWKLFEPYVCLEVKDGESRFCIRKKKQEKMVSLWYRKKDDWIQADSDPEQIYLPTYLFEYSVSAQAPVTEGELVIAVTEGGRDPLMLDCREINVHVV